MLKLVASDVIRPGHDQQTRSLCAIAPSRGSGFDTPVQREVPSAISYGNWHEHIRLRLVHSVAGSIAWNNPIVAPLSLGRETSAIRTSRNIRTRTELRA